MIAYISIFLSSHFPLSLQNARLFVVSSHAAGTYFPIQKHLLTGDSLTKDVKQNQYWGTIAPLPYVDH